jgi:hypothetical protein
MALSILVVRALVGRVEQAGVPRERFLAATGKSAAWLEGSDTRLSVEEYDHLVELALEVTKDPALGLHMAETATFTTYSLVAHLIAYAPTMRQGIRSYLRYHRLLTDRSAVRLTEQGTSSTLVFEVPPGTRVCKRFHAEVTLPCAAVFRTRGRATASLRKKRWRAEPSVSSPTRTGPSTRPRTCSDSPIAAPSTERSSAGRG